MSFWRVTAARDLHAPTGARANAPEQGAARHPSGPATDALGATDATITEAAAKGPRATPAIVCAGVVRRFGARPVLRGVDLVLEAGERLALLGPNGAGKSTLLRVLATLTRPDAGSVRVAGYDVARAPDQVRRMVGYVGHQPYLYDELTARENLIFYARMYGVHDPERRARTLLERVGLAARAGERVRTFSRGQQQRLALARGILHDPRVLLLDEPETGLDEEAIALLGALLDERTRAGQATLLTTHQLERALTLAGTVALLARGKIVFAARSTETDLAALRAAFAQHGGRP